MMGNPAQQRQPALFSYHITFGRSVEPSACRAPVLRPGLGRFRPFFCPSPPFVTSTAAPAMFPWISRLIMKIAASLLFLYNIPSERELMEQIRVRLIFPLVPGLGAGWSKFPTTACLSKGSDARWGEEVLSSCSSDGPAVLCRAGWSTAPCWHTDRQRSQSSGEQGLRRGLQPRTCGLCLAAKPTKRKRERLYAAFCFRFLFPISYPGNYKMFEHILRTFLH